MKFIIRNKAGRVVRTVTAEEGGLIPLADGETARGPLTEHGLTSSPMPRHEHHFVPFPAQPEIFGLELPSHRRIYCEGCGESRPLDETHDDRRLCDGRTGKNLRCYMVAGHLGPHQ